jgi:hypothetical protein
MNREYVIAAMRSAALRARLLANEIDVIGVALRDGIVTPEAALLWARDIGALDLVGQDDAEFDATDMLEAVP